jgi:hypothetical protein
MPSGELDRDAKSKREDAIELLVKRDLLGSARVDERPWYPRRAACKFIVLDLIGITSDPINHLLGRFWAAAIFSGDVEAIMSNR